VPFLVLAHVNAHHGVLVVEEELGQGARQFGLAHAGRPQEEKGAHRSVRVLQAGPATAHGVGDGADGVILPDHALMQPLFHAQQFLDLALQQA